MPAQTQVLIAGAGPIGLTAAIELARRGIVCRIIDPLLEPPQYAKAVGVQPRTLEVFEGMGVLRRVLDAGVQMRGQVVYVNGEQVAKLDLALPDDVPFGFLSIPQYATERILREELAMHGVQVERGVRLAGFEQDADGVTATLADGAGEQTVRAGIPGRRRRSPQHRPQGAGPDVRGCGLRGAVHARRCRGGLVDARAATASAPCTRPTVSPTTCSYASRCQVRSMLLVQALVGRAIECRCWCPTSWRRRRPSVASPMASRAPSSRSCTTSRR